MPGRHLPIHTVSHPPPCSLFPSHTDLCAPGTCHAVSCHWLFTYTVFSEWRTVTTPLTSLTAILQRSAQGSVLSKAFPEVPK